MKTLLTIFLSLLAFISFSQDGPGGVGNTSGSSDLSLWLKAGDINQISGTFVTNWLDASGKSNDASATSSAPLLLDNQLNGHPTVNFSSTSGQYMMVPHSSSLNSPYVSVFLVGRMNASSNSKGTYLIKTTSGSIDDGFGLLRLNSKEKIRFYAGNYGVNRDSEHFHYGVFDLVVGNLKSSSSNDKITALVNNYGSSTTITGSVSNSNNNLYLGARPRNNGTLKSFLDGDIAEIIVLSKDVTSTERIIVSNYLAAKYGFGISNAKYSYYFSHPNDVIGIGSYNNNTHSNSRAGVLEIAESKTLTNGQFLMVGHDGASMNSITTNLPEEFSQRYERTWRSHVNGGITKEDIIFHVGTNGMPTKIEDYALLLDLDGDGDFSNATSIPASSVNNSNNTVTFDDVHLHTGAVFTLAYYQTIEWLGNVGTFIRGSGIGGAPDQTDGGRNLIIRSGAYGHVQFDASVYGVEIEPGAGVIIDSGVCITINSKIHNDGYIGIEESGSLIQTTEGPDQNSGSGIYLLQRTGLNSQYGYNNWSSPMKH
ncbi:MAG: hypothetical protein ACPGD5_07515, partial [Salibacteraceae bacterium]